ncbi:unnamed protein product [Cyprideis torosa]|uniref:Uncharacterized protein n=1 Tax=Cyprideis torosa TaxID=163714 RepID=A0A7R8WPC5_9CRUS|nr:unnamed protein product [Cyprideis torosa]CAG0900555.1 unnamed protein product [Cyprideis torosa]
MKAVLVLLVLVAVAAAQPNMSVDVICGIIQDQGGCSNVTEKEYMEKFCKEAAKYGYWIESEKCQKAEIPSLEKTLIPACCCCTAPPPPPTSTPTP